MTPAEHVRDREEHVLNTAANLVSTMRMSGASFSSVISMLSVLTYAVDELERTRDWAKREADKANASQER